MRVVSAYIYIYQLYFSGYLWIFFPLLPFVFVFFFLLLHRIFLSLSLFNIFSPLKKKENFFSPSLSFVLLLVSLFRFRFSLSLFLSPSLSSHRSILFYYYFQFFRPLVHPRIFYRFRLYYNKQQQQPRGGGGVCLSVDFFFKVFPINKFLNDEMEK